MMKINKTHLNQAVNQNIISIQQAEQLWALWTQSYVNTPEFRFAHLLYYLGGMIAIGAMSLFINIGWDIWGGGAFIFFSAIYAFLAYYLMQHFHNKNLYLPAGLCAAFVVVLTPLAVFGIQDLLGFWSDTNYYYRDYHHIIDWRWLTIELATLCTGMFMLWKHRYPILVLPLAFTLWYMSMDITDWIQTFLYPDTDLWDTKKLVSLIFGLLMLIVAIQVDFRSQSDRDYPFWLYIFGIITFWGGLTTLNSDSELSKFIYCLINVVLLLMSTVIRRRVFAVFGAIGICTYLFHLSEEIFKYTLIFPIVLTLLGGIIIFLGVWWQKNESRLREYLLNLLPSRIQLFLKNKY